MQIRESSSHAEICDFLMQMCCEICVESYEDIEYRIVQCVTSFLVSPLQAKTYKFGHINKTCLPLGTVLIQYFCLNSSHSIPFSNPVSWHSATPVSYITQVPIPGPGVLPVLHILIFSQGNLWKHSNVEERVHSRTSAISYKTVCWKGNHDNWKSLG